MGIMRVNKIIVGLLLLLALFLNMAQAAQTMDEVRLHRAIPLLDEDGKNVLDSNKPYSSKMSCGGSNCHNYETITHAFHIEQGRDEARDDFGAKRGFPALVGAGYYGGYNCMGGNNPERLAKKNNASAEAFGDLGSAGWVQRCSSCHAGGGWMEKDRNGRRYDTVKPENIAPFDGDYYDRRVAEEGKPVVAWDWKKSGVVENDCLMCHVDVRQLNTSLSTQPVVKSHTGAVTTDPMSLFSYVRNTEFIKGGFFRYANTALLSYVDLLDADLSARNQSVVSFVRTGETNTLDLSSGSPQMNWNTAAFTGGQVQLPMLRFPDNSNCMQCHRTGGSRRGFYGFGEDAAAEYTDDGGLIEDYQDDVHKGKIWTEANGEARAIENCNACHARNYYNKPANTADLDASHNFLKGNSDMDVRNDLDYAPGAKSCEYCHNDAENPVVISDYIGMLNTHRELWAFNGDMAGYSHDLLSRITQTHLDVVSCQACHITNKVYRGNPLKVLYRYREGEDGKRKITPYKAKPRSFWRDKNSGHVLNKTEADSVYKLVSDSADQPMDHSMSDSTTPKGYIIDPVTGAELAEVEVYMSHGAWRFREPETYLDFIKLKNAYDKLMVSKGVSKPDMTLVWSEPNAYLLSHNTRPSIEALQCADCHTKKSSGSFSSVVSKGGLLGEANSQVVVKLVDPRLVSEGIVELDLPYMKMDAKGVVTENVADILYATRLDPSMTILKSATAKAAGGELVCAATDDALKQADVSSSDKTKLAGLVNNSYAGDSAACADLPAGIQAVFRFQSNHGNDVMRGVSLLSRVNAQTEWLSSSRAEFSIAGGTIPSAANYAGMGGLVSDVISLELMDRNRVQISSFSSPLVVKLPYKGGNANLEQVSLITSKDGSSWTGVSTENIIALQAQSEDAPGYVAFKTSHFSYYALVDSTISVDDPNGEKNTAEAGGGGCTVRHNAPFDPLLPMLVVLSGLYLWRRRGVNS